MEVALAAFPASSTWWHPLAGDGVDLPLWDGNRRMGSRATVPALGQSMFRGLLSAPPAVFWILEDGENESASDSTRLGPRGRRCASSYREQGSSSDGEAVCTRSSKATFPAMCCEATVSTECGCKGSPHIEPAYEDRKVAVHVSEHTHTHN